MVGTLHVPSSLKLRLILAACAHVLFGVERKRRPGGVTGPWCQLGLGLVMTVITLNTGHCMMSWPRGSQRWSPHSELSLAYDRWQSLNFFSMQAMGPLFWWMSIMFCRGCSAAGYYEARYMNYDTRQIQSGWHLPATPAACKLQNSADSVPAALCWAALGYCH